jgi:hypothetical protein
MVVADVEGHVAAMGDVGRRWFGSRLGGFGKTCARSTLNRWEGGRWRSCVAGCCGLRAGSVDAWDAVRRGQRGNGGLPRRWDGPYTEYERHIDTD